MHADATFTRLENKGLLRKRGVQSAECGVWGAGCGVRSAECGVQSLKKN